MWEKKHEGKMGMEHGMMGQEKWGMMMLWEKLDDNTKKMLMMRKLDERIMKKEQWIADLQFKLETLKMMKTWIEKM